LKIDIKDLRKQDYKKAIQFAIKGMHFDWYLDNRFFLNAYGRYFWYLEINRATQILAAYVDDVFAGVLLAEIYGEERKHRVLSELLFVKFIDVFQKLFFKNGAGLYEDTVKQQLQRYLQTFKPDGEIIFLAADPDAKIKGVGSALLQALEEGIPGKTIYLHTDNACTYQFYEHRGFQRVEEEDIALEIMGKTVPLKCFIYSKRI